MPKIFFINRQNILFFGKYTKFLHEWRSVYYVNIFMWGGYFMEIKYENADDCIYAELSGELDEYSAEYVRLSLDDLLNKNLNAGLPPQ